MDTSRLVLAGVAETVSFFLGAGGSLYLFIWIRNTLLPNLSFYYFLVFLLQLLLLGAVPICLGFLAARRARRAVLDLEPGESRPVFRPLFGRLRQIRWLYIILFACYGSTWVFGVPSVLSDTALVDMESASATAEYYGKPVQPVFPSSGFAVALLPGLILVEHAHSGGGLHGWGGAKLYLWWGFGLRQVFEYPIFVT